MSLPIRPHNTNDASASPGAGVSRSGRRATPLAATKLLLPVWGYRFVRQFLEAGLPTLLAPGNVPALVHTLPCEFVILTSEDDEPFIRAHPTFHALSQACATAIHTIDHLITGTNYSTTLTLAYTEAVRATGPAMLDTCFFFLVSDYVVADGSLVHVMERMMRGTSGVLAGNFRVAVESALPWLLEELGRAASALALPPRELVRWGLAHVHPAAVANTVNFPLNHNHHTNRLFWRVDGRTLIGRFYLMHPIAVRPETVNFVVGASFDYSFIPEMCPSGNVETVTDSDEYLVLEMQSSEHEAKLLRPGPHTPRVLARTLSEWTTWQHRQNVRHSLVFHAGDLPETLGATIAEADRFIADVERWIRRTPQPHRGHPYWQGAIAAHKEATGEPLSTREQWLALGLPDDLLTRPRGPNGAHLMEAAISVVFGRPPGVRPWHPRRVDFAMVAEQLRGFQQERRQRLLVVADRSTVFTVSLADGGERVARLRKTPFLESRPETYVAWAGSFDLCLLELTEEDLSRADELVHRIAPLMKPNGKIVVAVYNRRAANVAGFTNVVSLQTARLMRPGATLSEVRVVRAGRVRWQVSCAIRRLAMIAYHRPWIGFSLLAFSGGALALCSLLANAVARCGNADALRPNRLATSVLLVLNVDPGGQDAYRYAVPPLVHQRLRRQSSFGDAPVGTIASARRPDIAPILPGAGRPGEVLDPVADIDGVASARSLPAGAIAGNSPIGIETARETTYKVRIEPGDVADFGPFGPIASQVWYDDPQRLGVLLSRYKFVAKMLGVRRDVAEVGFGDAFGTRVVLQQVGKVTVYNVDPVLVADIRGRFSERWPIVVHIHDIVERPLPRRHDALYSLDMLERISRQDEHAYLANLRGSVADDGVLIIGSSPLESHPLSQGRAEHINCKNEAMMKALLGNYFTNVFLFSMSDEIVHVGFLPTAHYLLAVCCGKK